MVKLDIDNREDKSRVSSCVKFFTDCDYNQKTTEYDGKGNSLTVKQMAIGDYIFDNKVVFEFKTPSDIINSIIDGRIFRQAEHMNQYPFSYVIIVGNVSEEINRRNQPKYWNKYNKMRTFTVKNYLGALARLYTYTKVIHVDTLQQCWILMDYLSRKLLEDKSVKSVEKPSFKLSDPIASFLGLIYINEKQRVSSLQAVTIREQLHLETLEDLLNVEFEDLVNVKGVGVKTAKKIMEVLK